MASVHGTKQSQYRARGVGLVLYSILFLGILGYGWYHLLYGTMHPALTALVAGVAAMLAWFIAKIIGGHQEGIRGDIPLFVFLLLISAIGVFNTLMLKLEGKTIYVEAIDNASQQYSQLPLVVKGLTGNKEADGLRARVETLKVQLAQEISNPRNCGDGPHANEIMEEIRTVLPGFQRYSGSGIDCSRNEQLIKMYHDQMDKLMYASPVFMNAGIGNREELFKQVNENSVAQVAKLDALKKSVTEGKDLRAARTELEVIATNYAEQANLVRQQIPTVASNPDFQPTLNISSARNIGEWGHLLPLMLSRLNKVQTWVYLAIAFFLDWLLVHMFARIAEYGRGEEEEFDRRDDPRGGNGGFGGAFK